MKDRVIGSWWIENLLRPVLIAGMMVCLAALLVTILEQLMLGGDGAYFLVFGFFAALEGILSERGLRKRHITGWSYLGSRGAELPILLMLLKLANYIPLGLDQLWADALIWPSNPEHFINPIDSFTFMLFVPLWLGALYVSRQASELDMDEGGVAPPPDKTSIEYYLWLTQPPPVRHRQEALDRLGELFLWGGAAILLASAAIHVLMPAARALALPTLLYFALGVALLSQARFGVAHASWQTQGIPIQHGIGRRWLVWAGIFLVSVTLIALLLPTEYAMGPVLALYSVIGTVAQVILLIVMLIAYLLALLLSLFRPNAEQPSPPSLALQPAPAAGQPGSGGAPPWMEALISAFFWTIILIILGYALIRFLRDRFGQLAWEEGMERTWWAVF